MEIDLTPILTAAGNIPGCTTAVHAEKSDRPIVWMYGITKQYKESALALGAVWSPKKQAWWVTHDRYLKKTAPQETDTAPQETNALPDKYAKLRDDLITALAAGRAAQEKDPEDGGACNFDACAVKLTRWNHALVERAAKEAGTSCFPWKCFRDPMFVFSPDTGAQGNARSRNAEAMTACMKSLGWDAMDYSQMD